MATAIAANESVVETMARLLERRREVGRPHDVAIPVETDLSPAELARALSGGPETLVAVDTPTADEEHSSLDGGATEASPEPGTPEAPDDEANPFRAQTAAASPVTSYGPLTRRVDELLDRAAGITSHDIEDLAAVSGRQCRAAHYAESLLALRRAAEGSGRSTAVGEAGDAAETLIVRIAATRCPQRLEDRARWNVVAEQAAWGAGDAARALVVSDVLPERHLRALTLAWDGLLRHR